MLQSQRHPVQSLHRVSIWPGFVTPFAPLQYPLFNIMNIFSSLTRQFFTKKHYFGEEINILFFYRMGKIILLNFLPQIVGVDDIFFHWLLGSRGGILGDVYQGGYDRNKRCIGGPY